MAAPRTVDFEGVVKMVVAARDLLNDDKLLPKLEELNAAIDEHKQSLADLELGEKADEAFIKARSAQAAAEQVLKNAKEEAGRRIGAAKTEAQGIVDGAYANIQARTEELDGRADALKTRASEAANAEAAAKKAAEEAQKLKGEAERAQAASETAGREAQKKLDILEGRVAAVA